MTVSGQHSSHSNQKSNEAKVIDGDWNTQVYPTPDSETGEISIALDFKQKHTFSNAFIKFAAYGMMGRNYLMVSDDGENYQEVAFVKRGQIYDDISCFQFAPITTRHAKFVFKPTDNKLLYTAMPKVKVSVREISMDNKPRIENWCQKAAHTFPFFMEEAERTAHLAMKDSRIALDSIIDVSEYLSEDGVLNWVPPDSTANGAANGTANNADNWRRGR